MSCVLHFMAVIESREKWGRWGVQIVEKDGAVSFAVRVQPRASRDKIVGVWQEGT